MASPERDRPTCTVYLWQPLPSVWCLLVKCSDGNLVHTFAEGKDAQTTIEVIERVTLDRFGCTDPQRLLLRPEEVPSA